MGHLLMENANALIVDAALTEASGTRRAGGGTSPHFSTTRNTNRTRKTRILE